MTVCPVSSSLLDPEGRVLLGQLLDRDAELLLVALGLRLDRRRDHRRRERHRLQHDRVLRVAERVTGRGLLQPGDGDDLAGAARSQLLTLVRVHLVDLADPLLAVLGRVEDLAAVLEHAGVDADEGQLAEVRVGRDLERQRGERLVVVGATLGRSSPSGTCRRWRRHRAATAGSRRQRRACGWTPLFLNAEPDSTGFDLAGDASPRGCASLSCRRSRSSPSR